MSKNGVPFENNRKKKPAFEQAFYIWSGREDSNLRHLAPHASALPG